MNAEEALKICRLAKAASPAQAVDEYTPELWALVLARYRFADAQDVIVRLAADQEWIHVSHVVKGIKRLRAERISAFGVLPAPPEGQTDDEWRRWHMDLVRRIGDGEDVPRPVELEPNQEHVAKLAELTRGAFREVPSE